jgi:post-segregation antitoxin (ccd killing protein)
VAILDFFEAARHEGRTESRAGALLTVLRVRGIAVSGVERERILAEKDLDRLERWLERAVVASSLAAVFDEPS